MRNTWSPCSHTNRTNPTRSKMMWLSMANLVEFHAHAAVAVRRSRTICAPTKDDDAQNNWCWKKKQRPNTMEKAIHYKVTRSLYIYRSIFLAILTVSHLVTELFTVAYFLVLFFTLIRQSIAYLFSECVCLLCSFYSFVPSVSFAAQQLQNRIYATLPINRAI